MNLPDGILFTVLEVMYVEDDRLFDYLCQIVLPIIIVRLITIAIILWSLNV